MWEAHYANFKILHLFLEHMFTTWNYNTNSAFSILCSRNLMENGLIVELHVSTRVKYESTVFKETTKNHSSDQRNNFQYDFSNNKLWFSIGKKQNLELFFRSFKNSINGCDHQDLWIMQEASNWNIWYSSWCIYLDKPSSTEAIRLFSRFSGREENFSAWISARNVTSLKYWAHRVGNCGGDHMFSLCTCSWKQK